MFTSEAIQITKITPKITKLKTKMNFYGFDENKFAYVEISFECFYLISESANFQWMNSDKWNGMALILKKW